MKYIAQHHYNQLAAEVTAMSDGLCVADKSIRLPRDWCENCRKAVQSIYMFNTYFSRNDAEAILLFWLGIKEDWEPAAYERTLIAAKKSLGQEN